MPLKQSLKETYYLHCATKYTQTKERPFILSGTMYTEMVFKGSKCKSGVNHKNLLHQTVYHKVYVHYTALTVLYLVHLWANRERNLRQRIKHGDDLFEPALSQPSH